MNCRRVIFSSTLFLLALILLGCQGSGHFAHGPMRGVAITIDWPTSEAAQQSRFIPQAAQSIVVTVTNGAEYTQTQTVARVAGGDSTATFTGIPLHDADASVTVTATAYPSTGGTGTALATATTTAIVPTSGLAAVSIDMNSTVQTLTINNVPTFTLLVNTTQLLTATARDAASGSVALVAGGIFWRSLDPTVVNIDDATGQLTTLAPGTATIKAVERESGIATQCTITVAPYRFSTLWGSLGGGNGQFNSVHGIAVDLSNKLLVADMQNNRIQSFLGLGAYLTQWGTYGTGDGLLIRPYGVAVDLAGNVYVSDSGNCRVQVFLAPLYLFDGQVGTPGAAPGQFVEPRGVGVDTSMNLYVVDGPSNRIEKFDQFGNYVMEWGPGQLINPTGLAVSASGEVYVCDTGNNCVKKYSGTGGLLGQFGITADPQAQLNAPTGVAVDNAGNVYVCDASCRVKKYASDGTYITQWGSAGNGPGQFNQPGGIAVDTSNTVYVSDTGNNRIQAFVPAP